MRHVSLLWAVPVAALSAAVAVAASTDYFVAPGGSDADGDGSMDRPYRTVGKALERADPGDRVVLRAGEYRLAKTLRFPRGGSPGRPITVTALGEEYVALLGSVRLTGWERHEARHRLSRPAPRAVGETRGLSPLPRQARGTVETSEACWKVKTPPGSRGGMVRGLYEDSERLTHARPYWGKRENPPVSELKAPGTWTQQEGWIYLWTREGDSPDDHRIEASQHGVVDLDQPWLRLEKLHLFFGEPTVCVISADHCEVADCEIAHCSNSVDNAYCAYLSGCSDSGFRRCRVHDSFRLRVRDEAASAEYLYWGDHGSNSHVVSCINCGDSGPNLVSGCEIFNGGLGVGTKGAAREMVITGCRISDVVNGVVISGERSSGPGAGKTDRGHYLLYRNHISNCSRGVYFPSGRTHANRIWNNLIERCGNAVYIRNYRGEPDRPHIANNLMRGNGPAVLIVGGRKGNETLPVFVEAGLSSHNNLYHANEVDWRNPLDWSRDLDMSLEEVKQYKDYGLEAGSLKAAPKLDRWGRAEPGCPTIGAGGELLLPDYLEEPEAWHIGLGPYDEDEERPEAGLTLSIAGSPSSVGPDEELKLQAVLANEFSKKTVDLGDQRDLIVTFHFRYLAGHFDKQELYRTRVGLPAKTLGPGEALDLTTLPSWQNPTNGKLGDPFHLRVDTKDWRAGCRLRATGRFVGRQEKTAEALQKLEDLLRSEEVLEVTFRPSTAR